MPGDFRAENALRQEFNSLPQSDLTLVTDDHGGKRWGTEGGPVYREAATGRLWFARAPKSSGCCPKPYVALAATITMAVHGGSPRSLPEHTGTALSRGRCGCHHACFLRMAFCPLCLLCLFLSAMFCC